METVLITGASKGLGSALSEWFLNKGWCVLGISRSIPPFEHHQYQHLSVDITNVEYRETLERFLRERDVDRIDLLINNAGVGSSGFHINDVEASEIRKQLDLHCIGALQTVQATIPYLHQSKIVNITSRLGSVLFNERGDFKEREFSYGYRIAKSAQNMLSLCLAGDDRLAGNLIISVMPGLLRTDSGSSDAAHSAQDGAEAVVNTIFSAESNGVYHAFGQESAF